MYSAFTKPISRFATILAFSLAITIFSLLGSSATVSFNQALNDQLAALSQVTTKLPVKAPPIYQFTRTLKLGSTGSDVKQLQIFLNSDPTTVVATKGTGSKGKESTYYGPATSKAVSKFQLKYKSDILTANKLTKPTGQFGPATLKKLNSLLAQSSSAFCPNGKTIESNCTDAAALTITNPSASASAITTSAVPVFPNVPPQIITAKAPFSFTVKATDPQGKTLNYSSGSLPQYSSFDPITQVFSWTPTDLQAGQYLILFKAQNTSNLSSSLALSINVMTSIDYTPVLATQPNTTLAVPRPIVTTTSGNKQAFTSLYYADMPDLSLPIVGTAGWAWFVNGDINQGLSQSVTQQYVQSLAEAGVNYVVIDIETNNFSLANWLQIISWIRQAEPSMKIGLFGYPYASYYEASQYAYVQAYQRGVTLIDPDAVWWATIGSTTALQDFQAYQRVNDNNATLLQAVDFGAPELYAHVDLSRPGVMQDFELFSKTTIEEARRVMPGKPIYPFVMPKYTPEIPLAYQFIPTDLWQQALQTIWQNADGFIVWDSGPGEWDPNAGWWNVIANGLYKN